MAHVPKLSRIDDTSVSLHATGIAIGTRGLAIVGPSGAGKSGLAAQMITLGARLIADDICIVRRSDKTLTLDRPSEGPEGIELRGFGIKPLACVPGVPLAAILALVPSDARLPDPAHLTILGQAVPLLSHPYRHDTAAKLTLWFS